MLRSPSSPSFKGHGPNGMLTEADARALLDECERLGMSLESFARSKGFHRKRLSWWRSKFKRDADASAKPSSDQRKATPAFVPVRIASNPSFSAETHEEHPHFELLLKRGRTLRIPQRFAPEALRNLLTMIDGAR